MHLKKVGKNAIFYCLKIISADCGVPIGP